MEFSLLSCGEIILRSIVSVIILFIVAKIIGPRQIAQLTFYDYVLGISAGSIAAAVSVDVNLPLWVGALAMLVYGLISVVMALCGSKNITCRRFFTGTPEILFYNGQFLEKNLRKNKLDVNDVTGLCRVNGFFDLNDLSYILIETNGSLSFLPKSQNEPLTPKDMGIHTAKESLSANVIIDGHIMEPHLRSIGKDVAWLKGILANEKIASEREVLLGTADRDGNFKAYYKNRTEKHTDLFD